MGLDSMFQSLLHTLQIDILPQTVQYVIAVSPVILAYILWVIFVRLWLRYVRAQKFISTKFTLLELKLPKETIKSPLAMEVFLTSLHNTSDGGVVAKYWNGDGRPQYSLEIVSIEGQVKFFIWTEDQRKSNVMSALYSQYPELEIKEVEDYAKSIHFDPKIYKVWACEFKFTKEDPYPIKTYVDYGLDKDPKEELKVDPLSAVLEWLGSVGPNQQVWIQIIIRGHNNNQRKPGHLFKKTDLWKDKARELVDEILIRDPDTKVSGMKDDETGFTKLPTISKGEQAVVEAIERSITKFAFDTGIRGIYIAKKESFNGPFGTGGLIGSFKQFSTEHLNGFKPNGDKWTAQFGDPWKDFRNRRKNMVSAEVIKAYRRRGYFLPPYDGTPLVMNTEELATIFHFPGQVAAVPTLERIPSKRSQAPSNLPI